MKVHEHPTAQSKRLGRFKAGTRAHLVAQWLVVWQRGEYLVMQAPHSGTHSAQAIRKGDVLDLLLNEGEGLTQAYSRRTKTEVSFGFDDGVILAERKPTVVHDWTEVQVGKVRGYTQDRPFEGCLE